MERHWRVDGVPRGPGGVGNHEPLLSEEPVDEGGFTDVGTTDDGDAQRVRNLLGDSWDTLDEDVQHVPRILAIQRRYWDGIAGTELIKLEKVGRGWIVDLIGNQHPRLPRLPEQLDYPRVARMQSRLRIDDEHQQIRFVNRLENLALDLDIHRNTWIIRQAAGINQPELPAIPLGSGKMSIARCPGFLADDGVVLTDDAVEQR